MMCVPAVQLLLPPLCNVLIDCSVRRAPARKAQEYILHIYMPTTITVLEAFVG